MRKFLLSSYILFLSLSTFSQDFSNKGKEFWLAYSYHVGMVNPGNPPAMTLYLTSDVTTTYNVAVFGVATLQSGTINANQVISVVIPNAYFINAEGIFNGRTIHVTAAKPIVAYSFITRNQASAASLCLPTNVLGREYFAASFTQVSNEQNSSSFITIIAVEDNTSIEIVPTATTKAGWLAGSINTIVLNKGQIYQVLGVTTGNTGVDLSGTTVKSVATATSGCKKIAVFSGSGKLALGCSNGAADNLYQQMYPVNSWGKKFLTVPSFGKPNNYYRIMRSTSTANVTLNGTAIPAASFTNNYYQFINNIPNLIESDQPISVTQYFTSQNCLGNGSPYDPDMIVLNPVEQNINRVTLVSSPLTVTGAHQHHLQLVMKNIGTGISSFRFDGATVPAASWVTHPRDASYSYIYFSNVAQGNHTLVSDSGFNALAYGYGNAETYGYSAGANVKDLYQQIGVQTQYGIETVPSVCTGSPFRFKVSLPYCADSIRWNLSGLPGPVVPSTPIIKYTTCTPGTGGPDSTTIVNGVTLYWYSLPTLYNFATVGVFPVTITTYTTTISACGAEQDIDFDLQVSDPPTADFSWVTSGCVAEPFQFTETTPQTPKPTYSFWWNFGDPGSGANNISSLRNPAHTFSAPGTYRVRFADITTPGCLSDTVEHDVIVPALPSATIAGTTSVCTNAPNPTITFTATGGTAPFTFTYNINGGTNQTISTGTGNTVTLAAPTTTAGTFAYNLVSVKNTNSTLCTQLQSGTATVIVNPLPTAAISGSTTLCQNAAQPLVTFTGAAGTAPYTFSYNINGGASQTITTSTGNSVTLAVPTATTGTFVYNLLTVTDGSSTACSQPQTGSSTIIIRALPTATVAGTTAVCLNSASATITFTGSGGTAPYTFTYNINAGTNLTVTSTGNTATVAVPTAVAGTFIYNLVGVREAGAFACSQPQAGAATVTVNPLPSATISGTITVCRNGISPNITFTGSGSTAPYTFTYNINGGPALVLTTSIGNTVTLPVPTTTAGTFVYNLVSVRDGSATTCNNVQTGAATVVVRQLATATIAGNTTACLNGPSPNITFTGAVGTAPYTFTYNVNGGATQSVSTTTGNAVTVPVPTGTTGTFTYNLLSVQEGSANACSQPQTGSAVVTISPLPTAVINGTAAACLNAATLPVTFTGSGGTAPYTFTYSINGGAPLTATTTSGNSVAVAAPTNLAGTFTYNLVSVRESGAAACSQAQVGSAAVTIYPLPTLAFGNSTPACETRLVNFTDNSVANAGSITNWSWNFGDVASGGANVSSLQNPSHIFSAPGNYTVGLTVTTSNGCSNATAFTKVVSIYNRPLAGYIIPEVCLSDTYAQFTDTSKVASGTITGWNWNFGDANATVANPNTSTLQNPTHSYTAVGNYNVQLIAITNNGCRDTISQVLAINGSFPVANFTVNNPTTLCANDSVAIVNTSTVFPGNITRVEVYWDNVNAPTVFQADDFPVAGKVYRHLYPNFQSPLTKTFTIRYRAYSGGVCVNDRISTVVVNAAPKVQFNAMPPVCFDATPFQITQASETGAVPGSFVFSGPGVSAPGIFSPGIAGIGTHTIKYTYTSSAGGCVDSLSRTITVVDTASARFNFVSPACQGTGMSFTDVSVAPAGVTLTSTAWNFGDGTPIEQHAPGSTFTHTFPSWGPYTVTMFNTSAAGCRSSTVTKQILISPTPAPDFSFVEASVCLPRASVSFIEQSTIPDGTTNALTYAWNFGDPASGPLNTSSAKNPQPHTFTGVGPFTVTLTVRSGSGCVASVSKIVDFIHPQPRTAFSFSKPAVCIGDAVTMQDLTDGLDGTVTNWFWNFGDASTSLLQNPTHLYTTASTFNVSLYSVNSHGCNSDTVTQPFTVNAFPVVDAGPDRVVLENGSILLQPVVSGTQLSYVWTPSTFLNNATIAAPTAINVTADVNYRLTVTARGGCESFDEVFLKVLKAPAIPNTFSPNGDGINEKWIIEYLDTYPDNKVQVFTRTGKLVFESRGYRTPWNGTLNGQSLPVDTYYYIIEPGSGRKPLTGYVTILK